MFLMDKAGSNMLGKRKIKKVVIKTPYLGSNRKCAVSKTVPYSEQSQELKDCMSIEL